MVGSNDADTLVIASEQWCRLAQSIYGSHYWPTELRGALVGPHRFIGSRRATRGPTTSLRRVRSVDQLFIDKLFNTVGSKFASYA